LGNLGSVRVPINPADWFASTPFVLMRSFSEEWIDSSGACSRDGSSNSAAWMPAIETTSATANSKSVRNLPGLNPRMSERSYRWRARHPAERNMSMRRIERLLPSSGAMAVLPHDSRCRKARMSRRPKRSSTKVCSRLTSRPGAGGQASEVQSQGILDGAKTAQAGTHRITSCAGARPDDRATTF